MNKLIPFLILGLAVYGYWYTTKPTPQPVQVALGSGVVQVPSKSKCTSLNGLPDPICTPGALNPDITQAIINQTICNKGWSTKSIRPPTSYTNKLKAQGIKDYGYSDTNMGDYEEDHLISLELGGAPSDPKNLWPESPGSPNPKDTVENRCHKMVCAGTITLAAAQYQISHNWKTACQ